MKKKTRITISMKKELLKDIEKVCTNRSRLIEQVLFNYLKENNIDTKNIIL